jgi:peroxiredoxin Q/BCP
MVRAWLLVAWGWLALAGPVGALQALRPLEPGDMAPPFTLPGSDGRLHSLSDHIGRRPVVLAWFPRVFATR